MMYEVNDKFDKNLLEIKKDMAKQRIDYYNSKHELPSIL